MTDPSFPPLRFPSTLRRSRLAHLAAVGALAVLPVACGADNDAQALGGGTSSSGSGASTTAPTVATSGSAADGSAVTGSPAAAPAPADAELVVDFTYTAGASQGGGPGGGRVRNPYIAVWVEDRSGNLIQTVALWYDQSPRGDRYLQDLRSWVAASGGEATSSGATRAAGSYSVAWDGTDLDGNPVPEGEYTLYVESAREHGPYSITSAPILIGPQGSSVSLADNGELSGLTATVAV